MKLFLFWNNETKRYITSCRIDNIRHPETQRRDFICTSLKVDLDINKNRHFLTNVYLFKITNLKHLHNIILNQIAAIQSSHGCESSSKVTHTFYRFSCICLHSSRTCSCLCYGRESPFLYQDSLLQHFSS